MKRLIYDELLAWKNRERRKPLLLGNDKWERPISINMDHADKHLIHNANNERDLDGRCAIRVPFSGSMSLTHHSELSL